MIGYNTHTNTILDYLSQQDPNIKFIVEMEEEGFPIIAGYEVNRNNDRAIINTVYMNKRHMDQYLHFRFEHPTEHKLSVVLTLSDGTDNLITNLNRNRKKIEISAKP